jgi:hypothetical protein
MQSAMLTSSSKVKMRAEIIWAALL